MEIFYSDNIIGGTAILTAEDSLHCARVLRHREGDRISVVDGEGTLYTCEIVNDNPKMVQAAVIDSQTSWHSHPYILDMAVCPTKNTERWEWFVEKAVELGVDTVSPVIGTRSERRVCRMDRSRKIALSAMKQSLKAKLPEISEPVSVREYIEGCGAQYKCIACCYEDADHPRMSLNSFLKNVGDSPSIAVLIGPEGDFSPEELSLALERGFVPVHLGDSRLRTETAAVAAVAVVYSHLCME